MSEYDIIFISETWFSENSCTFIPYYKLYRRDRDTLGGRVAIYIHEKHSIIEVANEDLISISRFSSMCSVLGYSSYAHLLALIRQSCTASRVDTSEYDAYLQEGEQH